jgi:myosin heavy subunit
LIFIQIQGEIKNILSKMRKNEAAIRIQSFIRAYWTRRCIKRMHNAAITIQKICRGYIVRKYSSPKRTIQQHKNSIDHQIKDTDKRIADLESQMRGLSQANATRMMQYESERRERAARVIQKHFKGFRARKIYSRAASPVKSIFGDEEKEDDSHHSLVIWDAHEEEIELENTVNSVVNRLHKDQFIHDSLLGLYGGVSREISVIDQEITKDRKLTANSIVSKLHVLHSLLDDYYGKDDTVNDSSKVLFECASLRTEIQHLLKIVKDGKF